MDRTLLIAMIASISSLFGVFIGAVVGFVGQWYSLHKQREQWEQERQAEHAKWLRDKLQEIYSNCIFYSETFNYHTESETNKFEAEKLNQTNRHEKKRWLNLLMIYHPFKGTEEYDKFVWMLRATMTMRHSACGEAEITPAYIIELAIQDPRLKKDIGE